MKKFLILFLLVTSLAFAKDIKFKEMPIGTKLRRKRVGHTFITKKNKVAYADCYALDKHVEADNVHFIKINFTQDKLFTKLKITNSILESCNLANAELDASNTIIDCYEGQRTIEETDTEIITTFYDKKTKEVKFIHKEPKEPK